MLKYYQVRKILVDDFNCFEMYHIPRESNTSVDFLSKLASTKKIGHPKNIIQETLQSPMTNTKEVMKGEKGGTELDDPL